MIVDDDIRSLAREPGRGGAADAVFAARARHQSDFPTERVHTSIHSFSRTFQRGEENASRAESRGRSAEGPCSASCLYEGLLSSSVGLESGKHCWRARSRA